jgi:hypothetical protein
MSKSKQATGGSAASGPGLGTGTGKSPQVRKVSIPGKGFKVEPNSSNRGKSGK